MSDDAVVLAFLERLANDRRKGSVLPLAAYQTMYPGFEGHIADAYASVMAAEGTTSNARGVGVPTKRSDDDRIGPYQLIDELGRGGQGVVYRAIDVRVDRQVALKVLTGLGLRTEGALRRFHREAAIASGLSHPNVCTVYEADTEDGIPYIAMQVVDGISLARMIVDAREREASEVSIWIRPQADVSGADPLMEVDTPPAPALPRRGELMAIVELVEKIARALHFAHESGIVHRDVKPGNILIMAAGEPLLTDFGLARTESTDHPTLTVTGDLLGTPAYMSPEQLTRGTIGLDRRTDVYSLGATLYEALTLVRPFEAPTREALYQAIQSKSAPDPCRLNAAVRPDLRVVLETALEKDRDRRYQTALDFAEDLRRVREYEPIAARPASAWIKLRRWAQRNPALACSLTAAGLALIVGFALTVWQWARAETNLALYDQMSDVVLVEELKAHAADLWPRRPHMLPRFSSWLERARRLHARLPLHETALRELRSRANHYDSRQQSADDQRRREVHSELFKTIAAERTEIAEGEKAVRQLRTQVAELEKQIGEQENEALISRLGRRREHFETQMAGLRDLVASLREELHEQEQDPRLSERLTWELSDPTDRWRHQVLTKMVRELLGFSELITEVEARQSFAATVEKRSIDDRRVTWDRCLEDLETNPKYAISEELGGLEPQVGLVPLGIDRDSGLWEFWHVDSGETPGWEGTDWATAASGDPRGKAQVSEASGVVFVLLPRGTFWMGATPKAGSRNHDPEARSDERPVHQVTLGAFFMAKYELTQGQWQRLMGANPSFYGEGTKDYLGGTVTALHPVTNVNLQDCRDAMRRWDLELPTEERWEYACRAGTSTVYWSGDSVASIQERRAGNIGDKTASELSTGWTYTMEVNDGHVLHAPVGAFAANAFGLHDVLGNAWEWCEDRYAPYGRSQRDEEERMDDPGPHYGVSRGGCFNAPSFFERSAERTFVAPSYRGDNLGCRASRSLR